LNYIYGALQPRTTAIPANIVELNQTQFMPPFTEPYEIGMNKKAFAYVPSNCKDYKLKRNSDCKLHVAYHGCLQTLNILNSTFYMNTGYNEWAESNDIIILYPQAMENVLNPKGCFDWWGYSGLDYAVKIGPQNWTVKNMIDYVVSTYIN